MAEKTSTAKANEPAARGPRREAPPPVALGLTSTILELQQTAGNRSLGRLLGGALLQTKLRIGPAGDTYEREADRMADTVLRMPDTGEEVAPLPVSTIPGAAGAQRMCAQCEEEMLQREASASGDLVQRCSCHEEELVQTKTEGGPSPATPGFETRVAGLKGTGSPLPAPVRSFFEPRFGHDLGAVRVHTGTAAGEAARAVSARAFTVGNDVVFGAGEWSPETTEGRRLLAHELTHVVQQTPLVARREPLLQRAPLAASDAVPHAPAIPALAPANGPEGDPAGELEPPLRAEPGTAALSPGGSSPPEDQGGLRALLARLGAGLPLSSAIRSRMETAFGRSFAHVRVHTDSAAAGLATTLGARAFTVGEHIAFGAQEYRPGTLVGDALIAHELAHVAQQGDTGDRFAPLSDHGAEYDALEQDADLAAAGVVASLWGRLRFWTRPRPRLASGLRLQRCCCGRHRETVPPNNFCTECDREDHPDWQCCTPRMLQEIQDYRTQASDAVANALRALEPGNLARYASQLEKHFHLAPDDPRVAHVREQFARMDASLRGGSILFLCRAPGDPHGCEKPNVRAYSSNCTSGNGAIALCGHYNEIRDPASDNLLDPSHKGTFIHEFAHVACESGSGFIRPAGQETYYETGAFPGTADEAIHQADCYENFALEVGVVPASAAPAAAATQQDVVPEAVADASLPKCEYEEVGDWIPDPENRKQKLFGLTRLAGPIEFPAFAVAPSGKGVVVQETHPTPPTIKCQFLKPGLYLGDNMAAVEGRPLPVRVRWRITPRGSDLVKQGEREHCNDLIVAYDLSVRRLTGAINELATKKKVFANEAEARAELVKTVKLKPEDAPKYFQCIGRAAAAERDENRKWHTPKKPDTPEIREEPEGREGRKVKVPVYPLTEKSLPEVGRHSSLEVTTSVTPKCDNLLITAATPPEDVQGACAACEEELSTAELGVQPCPCEEEQDLPARAQPEEPDAETPVAEEEPAAALVVADEAETLAPGQMKKSDFFARLRPEVCAAAEAGLAGTEHSARGCPLIEFWLGYYEGQDVERINRDLPRFAGEEGPRPTTAEGFIALIAARVRASVETWARTGEITGVPQGLPLPGMGLPGLGVLGGIGGVFFKANPGGPRDPGDPRALQARLGTGRPLDGAIRSRMEGVFGRSFSHVRVHTDGGAAGLATGLNAKAFTVGEHVAFGAREYRPGTLAGDALIAHELAHVTQQEGGAAAHTGSDETLERDADLAGGSAVASLWGVRSLPRPEPRRRAGLRLQRCGGCSRQQARATTPGAAAEPPACEPTPVKLETLQAEAPFGPDETTLGYTQLAPTSQHDCTPQFGPGPDATPGTCSFTPRPVRLELISKYVKDGDYPTNLRQPTRNCGDVPIKIRISETTAEWAKKGEQEHCKDIRIAFDRTVKPCSNALASLAKTPTPLTGNKGTECLGDLATRLGFNPRNCSMEFNRLHLSTRVRDEKKWHAFKSYRISESCEEIVAGFRRASSNRIDDKSVKPEILVPQPTGCASTAAPPAPAAPASTPAPPGPQSPPQPVVGTRFRVGSETPRESPVEEPAGPGPEEAPVAEGEPAAELIVEDSAETLEPGQMKKSEFFARLRPAVREAAAAGAAGSERSREAVPFVDRWLDGYEAEEVERINRDLTRFAGGEGPPPTTAEAFIPLIATRVRTGVESWVRTGEIPAGMSLPGMDLPGLGALGGLLGGLGGVFFKAHPGGPRDPGDPRALQARLGAGQPLDGSIRSRMESTFGRSFSHVRVHADSGAAGLAASLDAKAFTVGEHVAFGAREYRPGTLAGDALIAHELAHVAQQAGSGESFAPLDDRGAEDDTLERDADRAAASAVLSLWGKTRMESQPEPRRRSKLRLSRCKHCNGDSAACRPVIESFDAVKGSEPVMSPWFGQCRLALGTMEGPPGMSFAPEGEVPEGCSGELQFVQLIDSCREKRRPSGESIRRKSSGLLLDTTDPYGTAPGSPPGRVPPGSRIGIYTNDTPGVDPTDTPGGPPKFDQVSADDKFKMWLLWKPDEPPGAPRVPLWVVDWSWKGKATRTGKSGDCASDWTVSGAAEGGTGKPTGTLPTWSGNIKKVPWVPGTCEED